MFVNTPFFKSLKLTATKQIALGIVFMLPIAGLVVFDVLVWIWRTITGRRDMDIILEETQGSTRDRTEEAIPALAKSNSSPDLRREPVLKPDI